MTEMTSLGSGSEYSSCSLSSTQRAPMIYFSHANYIPSVPRALQNPSEAQNNQKLPGELRAGPTQQRLRVQIWDTWGKAEI